MNLVPFLYSYWNFRILILKLFTGIMNFSKNSAMWLYNLFIKHPFKRHEINLWSFRPFTNNYNQTSLFNINVFRSNYLYWFANMRHPIIGYEIHKKSFIFYSLKMNIVWIWSNSNGILLFCFWAFSAKCMVLWCF